MKKIILTVVAAMMMAVSFAETTNTSAVKNVEEAGLTFDLRRLAVTLDLTDNQMDAVKVISDNFNDELISASTARRFQRHALIQQAIRKDAKQMRNVLNDKQFNTYMQLLGATLQNRSCSCWEPHFRTASFTKKVKKIVYRPLQDPCSGR